MAKRGRPNKWATLGADLVAAVDQIAAERGRGIPDAIGIAKKRDPKKWTLPVATLEARYHEHRQATLTTSFVEKIEARIESQKPIVLTRRQRALDQEIFGETDRLLNPAGKKGHGK